MLKAIVMMQKRFEITVVDPITQAEFDWFYDMLPSEEMDCSLTNNGRILMVEGVEDIYELVSILAEHEFVHDIGLIREVIDYEPQYDDEDMHYLVDFDND